MPTKYFLKKLYRYSQAIINIIIFFKFKIKADYVFYKCGKQFI